MTKTPLRDLVVVLPGIMGSVLEGPGGTALWDPGYGMARRLFGHRKWVRELTITGLDDPGDTSHLNGVRPVSLVESKAIVPGIKRIGGYSELHQALDNTFDLVEGDQHDPARRRGNVPPNYFRFAYDWRRDNRASAMQLKELIDVALPAWRQYRSDPNAKVILVAHSMGGMVARWYLEGVDPNTNDRLEGWRNVRDLYTFGTPYRGSLNALQYCVEGFKVSFVDFSEALRGFTSVHQLLPRFPAILDKRSGSGQWIRPSEARHVGSLDAAKAEEARSGFHEVIDGGVLAHRDTDGYDDRMVSPIIGFGHDTDNSAVLTTGGLELRAEPAVNTPAAWQRGDGTVPYVSAVPLDYDGLDSGWDKAAPLEFVNKKHGTMQTDADVLARIIANKVLATQVDGGAVRALPDEGPVELATRLAGGPQMGLNLPDTVPAGTPVPVTVRLAGVDPDEVEVTVTDLGSGAAVGSETLVPDPDGTVTFALAPGDYEVRAARKAYVPGIGLLHSSDLVAVIPEEDQQGANDD
ncbi:MAG: hypothetical protein OES24_07925 [Acidimicrobiia bacterium]|nr:hypothetical protein [Acidimicrobiia bacterium]